MKQRQINLVCAILALLCMVSTLVPIIAPRFPAAGYYAPAGNTDYYFTGDYFLAKAYWSVTDFAAQSLVWRIIISVDQAMLLLWAWIGVRGEAGKWGLAVAVINLLVVGIIVVRMLGASWGCRWGVLAVMVLDIAASIVLAAISK